MNRRCRSLLINLCLFTCANALRLVRSHTSDTLNVIDEELKQICKAWAYPGVKGCQGLLSAPMQHHTGAEAIRAKLKQAMVKKKIDFVFFGDSVFAGHDNFYNETIAPLLQNMAAPIFQKLGVQFRTHNFAVGNIGEFPFTAGCLSARLGDELMQHADIVTWQWEMYGDHACEKQHFLAEVYDMPGKPVLLSMEHHHMLFEQIVGDGSDDPLDTGKDFGVLNRKPRSPTYYMSNDFISESQLEEVVHKLPKNFDEKSQQMQQQFTSMRESSQLVPIREDLKIADNNFLGYYHLAPASVMEYFDKRTFAWWMSRWFAVNMLWHPGPIMHQLMASQIMYFLLSELRAAIADTGEQGASQLKTKKRSEADAAITRAKEIVKINCGKSVAFCATEIMPSKGAKLSAYVDRDTKWQLKQDSGEADYRRFWSEHGSCPGIADALDSKMAWVGTKEDGPLSIRLSAQSDNMTALVCEPMCGNSGCEKHRGWISYGPKVNYLSTINNIVGEGELEDGPNGLHSQLPDNRGQRYTDEEKRDYGIPQERPFVSDVAVTVDGVAQGALHDLQHAMEDLCKDCVKLHDACLVVATGLPRGSHTVTLNVNPVSFKDPNMHVAIASVMLV